jgi:hypothetical protein
VISTLGGGGSLKLPENRRESNIEHFADNSGAMNGGGANGSLEHRGTFGNKVYPVKNMNSILISPRNSPGGGGLNGSVAGHGSKTSNNISAHNSEDSARTEDKTA